MPISPAHAAQLLNISRRTIMRAIETHEIKAFRDNKNHWKIAEEELERWAKSRTSPSEHAHAETPTLAHPENSNAAELAEVRTKLAVAEARLASLEMQLEDTKTDRDHWRSIADKLSTSRSKWLPWRR